MLDMISRFGSSKVKVAALKIIVPWHYWKETPGYFNDNIHQYTHGWNPGSKEVIKGSSIYYPLHLAVKEHRKDLVEHLLANGGDVGAGDDTGNTPLHLATKKEIAELLLAKGADVNARNHDGYTPLHLAVKEHRSDLVEYLLAN